MRIMSIVCNCYNSIVESQLDGLVEYFGEQGIDLEIEDASDDNLININTEETTEFNRVARLVKYYVASVVYNILIEEFIAKNLNKHLNETYGFLTCQEIGELKRRVIGVLKEEVPVNDTVLYCMNYKNKMIDKITEFLSEGDFINIRGFLNFRYREFECGIEVSVGKVAEMFVAEKEYNEFISLLKYFVDIQDSKADKVDIYIDRHGRYRVVGDKGENMMESMAAELHSDKNGFDVSSEDFVISCLITTCPKKIVIHEGGEIKNKELINTIKKVFEERVSIIKDDIGKYEIDGGKRLKDFIKIPVDTDIKL